MSTDAVLIIIPAFNERDNVAPVVEGVLRVLPSAHVVVVDDGSTDDTSKLARNAGASVLRLPVNLGYGAALQAGYKWAVRRGYPLIGQLDGDGQHPPEYLPAMFATLTREHADVVIGSRFLNQDGTYRPSVARKVGIALFSGVASLLMRQHITDPTSGFQVMRLPVAQFFSSEAYPSDYPDADILILLHRSGFLVREVPVQMHEPSGKSMHSGHHSVYYVYKMWLSILVTLLRRPIPHR